MLSYVLGLPRDRIATAGGGDPLIVVDDCSLTGLRFRQFLRSRSEREVVFAHLYSHPALRAALEAESPRVSAVLAARDLLDRAPELLGDGYADWSDRWKQRGDGGGWTGRPDLPCFPWSEPEFTFWNEEVGAEQVGWRLVPRSACLASRHSAHPRTLRLHVQPPGGSGSIRPNDRTFYADFADGLLVANLESNQVVRLDHVAADCWRAIVRHASMAPAVEELAMKYEVDRRQVSEDLEDLVADCARRGLLDGCPAEEQVG